MANLDKALVYKLENTSGVTSLVSSRIYPLALPQTVTLPALVYQEIGGKPTGVHREATLLPAVRMQLTAWGDKFTDVVDIDAAVKTAIDGYRGTWGTGAYVTTIEMCQAATTPRDFRDPETLLYSRVREYLIMWKE